MTGNLPASTVRIAMTSSQICNALELVHPGQKIDVTYHVLPHLEEVQSVATCLRRRDRAVDLNIPELDEGQVITLPVPLNHRWDALQILKLVPHEYFKLPLKPFTECNQQPATDATAVIYADGGAVHEKGGPAAAAISVFKLRGTIVERPNFGRFYTGATNNCVEAAALLAASQKPRGRCR